jgi:hypothetical protein
LEEGDAEVEGGVADGGDGVGAGAVGEESASRVPFQFFAGEPAGALDITAFDLAAVNGGVEGVADIVEDVGATDV